MKKIPPPPKLKAEDNPELQVRILDAVLSRYKKAKDPDKYPIIRRILKAVFRCTALALIIWFFFFKTDPGTNLDGLEDYRQMMLEDHQRSLRNKELLINSLIQDEKRNHEITADSSAVFDGSRAFNDSIRAVWNPR